MNKLSSQYCVQLWTSEQSESRSVSSPLSRSEELCRPLSFPVSATALNFHSSPPSSLDDPQSTAGRHSQWNQQQAAESVHREAQFNLWAPLSWRHISMSVKQETRNQELQRTSITPIPLCVITLKPVGHFKDCVSTCVFMLLFVFPNVHNGLSVVWCVECFHVCGLLWRQRCEFNRLQLGVGAL